MYFRFERRGKIEFHLNVVEPSVDVVVLLHEVIKGPHLGTESWQHVSFIPGQVSGVDGRVEVIRTMLVRLQVILLKILQYRVLRLLHLELVFIIIFQGPEQCLQRLI